jgi:DNA-binding FrmR family transcriptional regulator
MNKKEEEVKAQNILTQINDVIAELEDQNEEVVAKHLHNVFIRLSRKIKVKTNGHK